MECEWHLNVFFFGPCSARIMERIVETQSGGVVVEWFMGAAKTLTKPDACSIPLSYVAICAHRSRSIEMVSRSCVSRVQQFAAERSVASHGHAWMHIRTVLARVLNSPAP